MEPASKQITSCGSTTANLVWSSIKGVMLDLSGTIHVELQSIPNAPAAIETLLASNLSVRFVTNTTKKCKSMLIEELQKAGFNHLDAAAIFTSASAARRLVESRSLRPYLLVEPALEPDFDGLDRTDPNCVVVGLAPSRFDYAHMNEAFRLVMGGAALIAIHKGRYWRDSDGGLSLGPGPFVSGLEFAAGVQSEVVGKPTPSFFSSALEDMGLQPEECIMIGDDLKDDVGGAQNIGMPGFLVRTGKYLPKDESSPDVRPCGIYDNVVLAIEAILESTSAK